MEILYETIDLTKIQTIILHNRSKVRNDHMTKIMNKTGLNYSIFSSFPRKSGLVSGIDSLIHIFKELLERIEFHPVLMLEDDVNTTEQFKQIINIPINSDCIYLGLSNCFSTPNGRVHCYKPQTKWIPINDEIVKISDMLSTHAYVITSKKWLEVLLKCMTDIASNPYSFDIPVAREMKHYNIYAFKHPFFFQDKTVGGQEKPTRITIEDISSAVF